MKIISFFFLGFSLFSIAVASTCLDRGPNVILFTWDGVRPYEFFKGTSWPLERRIPHDQRGEILKKFWNQYAQEGIVLGKNNHYRIGSRIGMSLPSYQAMMLGEDTECRNNRCGPIAKPSVLEHIQSQLNLKKEDVAVFASWNKIANAVARDPAAFTHAIYPEILEGGSNDPVMKKLQAEALLDLPRWKGSRKDHYTFELAHHYLKQHCPRVLYISLVDSDEYGHAGNYPGYVDSLRTYDSYLERLIETLKALGDYGKQTTLIVTTDHSRGPGPLWMIHGASRLADKNVFLYAWGRSVTPQGISQEPGNHLMLRPTLEYLMGLGQSGPLLPGIR
jgi:hypothetical protein